MIKTIYKYCSSCRRETQQSKGKCKWCGTPGMSLTKTSQTIVESPYLPWKKTTYPYTCPGCDKPFRFLHRFKDHKEKCDLL